MLANARKALEEGHSVVIGLQCTNEAQTKQDAADRQQKQPAKRQPVNEETWDSQEDDMFTVPARGILTNMLKKHWDGFPKERADALRRLEAVRMLGSSSSRGLATRLVLDT